MIADQTSFPALEALIAAAQDVSDDFATPTAAQISPMPFQGVPTMSSLQIAEITGKPHRNVTGDIARILAEAEIDEQGFLRIYKDSYNREQKCYLLPRRECDLVVSGYSVKYRLAIIDRWHELEAKQQPVNLDDPGCLRTLLLGYTEKVIALETAVSTLTPKADALDRLTDADGLMNITDAAKVLQVQPKALFSYLDRAGWTYRRAGHQERVPYQARIQSGHMVAKAHTVINQTTGEQTIRERALLTAKGIARLSVTLSKSTNH